MKPRHVHRFKGHRTYRRQSIRFYGVDARTGRRSSRRFYFRGRRRLTREEKENIVTEAYVETAENYPFTVIGFLSPRQKLPRLDATEREEIKLVRKLFREAKKNRGR